jgi:hypothetical protein
MTVDILPYLSRPRMSTYLAACAHDESRALELYRANARVSGIAYTSLHYVEVILRNALDRELRVWNQTTHGTPDWALDAAPLLLSVITPDRLMTARRDASRAVGRRRTIGHDDVVAQLSLGTWRYLLPSQRHQGKQKLWDDALERSFANRHGVRPDQIAQSLAIVYDFRNRIAHHEPVFGLDLRGKRRAMRDVLHSVSGSARKWFVEHEPFSGAADDFYREWPEFERKN